MKQVILVLVLSLFCAGGAFAADDWEGADKGTTTREPKSLKPGQSATTQISSTLLQPSFRGGLCGSYSFMCYGTVGSPTGTYQIASCNVDMAAGAAESDLTCRNLLVSPFDCATDPGGTLYGAHKILRIVGVLLTNAKVKVDCGP